MPAANTKILLVDDSEDLLWFLPKLLEKKGFEVDVAISKKELISKLISEPLPNLIMLDVRLSGDDGRKVCDELKGNSSFKKIPIILISGNPDLLKDYPHYRADDIIEKPFTLDIIVDKINTHLKPSKN